MDAANTTTRSTVIVQYTDPNGLFDQVKSILETQLPLGNLHWKSPSRPLRSIEALDVSFVKEESQNANSSSNLRRHQIPGLRQTPFVKVLLVRCDDKDTYKEKVRKEVKQWVKDNTPASTSKGGNKGQERHDAFEHLILHVVLPGTPAASQPRSSKHLPPEATDSTDSLNSKSKWTGKASSTVYDKLRADFHGSSKSSLERVAQVRIPDSGGSIAPLTAKDNEELWKDLVDKLKAAILQSFDTRVAQYEEDIQEREKQRSWPGWNFCTFFILKEGLAKGFENMGLFEDALSIYEELDAGLDRIVQEQANDAGADTTSALLPFSKDLKDTLRHVLDAEESPTVDIVPDQLPIDLLKLVEIENAQFPLKLEKRDYQQMILRNEISALDFRIYIFIRQTQIMLQRSRVFSTPKSGKKSKGFKYDANQLAEVCEKSVTFINFASRALRQDLYAAWGGQQGLSDTESSLQARVINNIVTSWKWSAALQMLTDCQVTHAIMDAERSREPPNQPNYLHDESSQISNKDKATGQGEGDSDSEINVDRISDTPKASSSSSFLSLAPTNLVGRLDSWAFWAGDLFSIMQKVLAPMSSVTQDGGRAGLSQNGSTPPEEHAEPLSITLSNLSPSLSFLRRFQPCLDEAYKIVITCACQCSLTAGRVRASRQLLMILAKIEENTGNLVAAAAWLDSIPLLLENEARTLTEASVLHTYGRLLRALGRQQDYVNYLLLSLRSLQWNNKDRYKASDLFEELLPTTATINEVHLSFEGVFKVNDIDNFIRHDDVKAGFSLSLMLKLLFPAEVRIEAELTLSLRAVGISSPATLSATYRGTVCFGTHNERLLLHCPVDTSGWYEVEQLEMRIGKLFFKEDLRKSSSIGTDEQELQDPSEATRLCVYPGHHAPSLETKHSPIVNLDSRKNIVVELSSKKSLIKYSTLRVRPATAGLRLDLQSCRSFKDEDSFTFEIVRSGDVMALQIGEIAVGQTLAVQIPYSLDNGGILSVDLKCELMYETEYGSFELYEFFTINITLPINVKVQDMFRDQCIFSRFTISPATLVPVSVVECYINNDDSCEAISGGTLNQPMEIFSKQNAHWLVKLKPTTSFYQEEVSLKLQLIVKCHRIDEVILNTIRERFLSDLNLSNLKYTSRLLVQHLVNKIQSLWVEEDLEAIGLTHGLDLWSYQELDWKTALFAFKREDRSHISQWLREWHQQHQVFEIVPDKTAPYCQLHLPVEIAPPALMITTNLKPQLAPQTFATVGESFYADLKISCKSASTQETEISYEVLGQSDTWLVGGRKKAAFTGTNVTATVLLVAQRTGQLLLPSIELRCRRKTNGKMEDIRFEAEHLSQTQSVQVIPNIQMSTVGIGQDGVPDGNWLVASERISHRAYHQ